MIGAHAALTKRGIHAGKAHLECLSGLEILVGDMLCVERLGLVVEEKVDGSVLYKDLMAKPADLAAEADQVVQTMMRVLQQKPPNIVSAALADITALFFASHVIAGDPERTKEAHEALIEIHVNAIRELIPVNFDKYVKNLAAYQDPRFSERACDKCGKRYRGPAVYCSIECAEADA
jgi:phosphoenolpyruvate-protein kinase (PTS system EI component)